MLIQNGAQLVTSSRDILEYCNFSEPEALKLSEEYETIYNLIGQFAISTNEIARAVQKDVSKVTEILCMLELDGYITSLAGNTYVRRQ